MTDGTTAKLISPVKIKKGDRVLVYQGQILKFHWDDMKYIASIKEECPIIVCFEGVDTGDFSKKKYYKLVGGQIIEISSPEAFGYHLIDDGKYGLIWAGEEHEDPDDFEYIFKAGNLNIPHSHSGIPAKNQTGKHARIILNAAIEDGMFIPRTQRVVWGGTLPAPYDYTFEFLIQQDSLSYAPYKYYGNKPFISRYNSDQVHLMNVQWAGEDSTLYYDAFLSDNFFDTIPIVARIYKIWQEGNERKKEYVEIEDYSEGEDAIICVAPVSNNPHLLRIIRAKDWTWFTSAMAEPIREEIYDMNTMALLEEGDAFHRCADPESEECFMVDSWIISGKTYNGTGFTLLSGQQTIADDIKIPYTITEDNQMTYVRMQKDEGFTQHNCGVYVNGELIEESGMQEVITIYGDVEPKDDPSLLAEWKGPLLIRQTAYKFLHVHHDSKFHAALYRKTVYVDHSAELLPYTAWRDTPILAECQVRKTLIRSKTTFHLVVNGIKYDIGHECNNREYRLTVLSEEYSGDPLDNIHGYLMDYPWYDVGYDKDGEKIEGEINREITRIFSTQAAENILIGFDIFPIAFRHDLVYDEHENLTLDYKEDIAAFPPSCDGIYDQVSGRKWLLFGIDGKMISDIKPPQIQDGDSIRDVNRINGLCMISKEA